MYIEKNGLDCIIEMEPKETIQVLVPASMGISYVHLSVSHSGKLEITGDSSIIEGIIGKGMAQKIKHN